MTTVTAPATRRRGSFLETWRLFADGWRRTVAGRVADRGQQRIHGRGHAGRGKDPVRFAVFMIVFMLPCATWFLERQAADRLAFLSLVPQPVPPKWLVLAPMCVIAAIAGAITAAFGHRPAVAGLAVLGCALWMVGSTRWLHRFGLWAFVAWICRAAGARRVLRRVSNRRVGRGGRRRDGARRRRAPFSAERVRGTTVAARRDEQQQERCACRRARAENRIARSPPRPACRELVAAWRFLNVVDAGPRLSRCYCCV